MGEWGILLQSDFAEVLFFVTGLLLIGKTTVKHMVVENPLNIIAVPLLNMTSAAPLSVVLSLLSQRKEGKRGRSVSHV